MKTIGKGGYGDVSLYYDKISKKEVVIKKITKSGKDEEEKFNREVIAMKNLKCTNSVEYYDHYSDNDFYYIVMEKCDEDLRSLMERYKGGLSDSIIKNILLQLNKVFKIMYSKKMIHRDLKPENILIKHISQDNFIIKLADFGLSREFKNNKFSTQAGTQFYSAPEQLSKNNYEPTKCD